MSSEAPATPDPREAAIAKHMRRGHSRDAAIAIIDADSKPAIAPKPKPAKES